MAKNIEDIYGDAEAEIKYYDMLYGFAGVVTKANEQSFEGWELKKIAGTLRKAAEAFCRLCMVDTIAGDKRQDAEPPEQKKELPEKKEEPPAPPSLIISSALMKMAGALPGVPFQGAESDRHHKAGKLPCVLQAVQG